MFIELGYIIIAFIFLLYYSGVGFTRMVIPEKFRDYEILVIPFIGLFTLLFFAHTFSFAGLGSRTFTWIILLLVTPLNIYIVWKKGFPYLNLLETFPVFVLSAVVFIIGMIPLFYEGYLTVVGINGDAAHYALLADHFLTNGVEPPKDKGVWTTKMIADLLTSSASRLGPMYFQSMVGAVTGLEGYKTFTVLINLFNSITLISAYLFVRGTGLLQKRGSILAVALLGINSLLYWGAINDYLAHVMMRSVLPLALAASLHMLAGRGYKGLSFSIAVCSAILMTSPESMVLLLGPLFLFALINGWRKELQPGEAIKAIAIWGLSLAIINILPMSASFEWLYNLFSTGLERGFQTANPGDVGYFIPLTEVLGFTPPHHYLYREVIHDFPFATPMYLAYFYASYVAAFIVLLLAGFALLRTDRQRQIILVSISAAYLLLALYLRFTFPYGYYKIASAASFFPPVLVFIGLGLVLSGSFTRAAKMFVLPIAASIALLSLASSYILLDMVVNDKNEEWITINKELMTLRNIQKNIKKGEPILLEERLGRGNKYYWIAYIMQDNEVLTRRAILGTEPFRDKELSFKYVIDGGYKYQQYIDDGWTPVIATSRYIMLGKR